MVVRRSFFGLTVNDSDSLIHIMTNVMVHCRLRQVSNLKFFSSDKKRSQKARTVNDPLIQSTCFASLSTAPLAMV